MKSTLRLAFLVCIDPDHNNDGAYQSQCLVQVAQQKIDDAGCDQQKDHGLAQDLKQNVGELSIPASG